MYGLPFVSCRCCYGVLMLWTWCCLFSLNLGFARSLNHEGLVLLNADERIASDPLEVLSIWTDNREISHCLSNGEVLLDNNEALNRVSESYDLAQQSSSPGALKSWSITETTDSVHRKLMSFPSALSKNNKAVPTPAPVVPPSVSPSSGPSASPKPPSAVMPTPSPPTATHSHSPPFSQEPSQFSKAPPVLTDSREKSNSKHVKLILIVSVAGAILLLASIIAIFFWQSKRGHIVKPWVTGLSGQLQKAFVTGVPKLKRSELESACEDFSNVIGSSIMGNVYKGTLSSGEEIAVTSVSAKSASDWSANLELQFRRMIDTLSKVNHKNFVNLVGFCEEEEPFTRMLVFEYAPNGTLFEHLHIKEAEHLDWKMRLRIAMGMTYCLEHMHQLRQCITHKNLNSSAINLTEDYAAKISYFPIWNDAASSSMEYSGSMEVSTTRTEANVYSFGVTLFEMITGTLPFSATQGSLNNWASDYLIGLNKSLKEIVDPGLTTFDEGQLEAMLGLIKSCVHPDPTQRPTMADVTETMEQITSISPDEAIPRLSPLWWAELEILSTEGA